jgi:hypothetical protein
VQQGGVYGMGWLVVQMGVRIEKMGKFQKLFLKAQREKQFLFPIECSVRDWLNFATTGL